MRDLPAPTPSAQQALARMYAQRVPSRPKQIGRMPEQQVDQPWYEKVGRAAFGIVASPFATALDVVPGYEPEDIGSFNIFEQGGKSLQHVAGDAYQLGRSVLTGKDTLSESPSARAYQQAGGGLMGTAAAALPYVDVASVVAPFAKGMTPAGALAIERAAGEAASSRALGAGIANARPLTRPSALAEEMAARAMDIPELLRFVQEVRNAGFSANEFPKEFKAVNDYFNQNAPQYQIELRSPGRWPDARPNIALIDSLFERSAGLQRPTILYRGIKNSNYIPQQKYAQIIKNLKVGDVLEEPGYMSTSIDRDMAEGFSKNGFVFEIEAPAGSKVISPLMNDELLRPYADPERELLLPRNTKLQIVAIDGNTIRARIVG